MPGHRRDVEHRSAARPVTEAADDDDAEGQAVAADVSGRLQYQAARRLLDRTTDLRRVIERKEAAVGTDGTAAVAEIDPGDRCGRLGPPWFDRRAERRVLIAKVDRLVGEK